MKFEAKNPKQAMDQNLDQKSGQEMGREMEIDDAQVAAALRRFRASVHGWSEQEYKRASTARGSASSRATTRWFGLITRPAMAWGLAAVLLISAVAVPLAVRHEQALAAQAAAAREEQRLLQQKLTEEEKARQVAYAVDDEELLKHVDSDIAQDAPDAMQPLASLMSDSASK